MITASDHLSSLNPSEKRGFWLAGAFLLLGILKLVLVADRDIIATFRGHDDLWQIASANVWYWRRPYDHMAAIHLPIYPVALAALSATGIPLRIATEALYLVAGASFSIAWMRLGLPTIFALLSFTLIGFHPYSFGLFDCALAEILYACLMLFAVGEFIRVLGHSGWRDFWLHAGSFALLLGLAWHTRKESVLLGGFLALVSAVIGAALLAGRVDRPSAARWFTVFVAAPAAASALIGGAVIALNAAAFGLWATNDLAAPGYVRAYTTLQRIDADPKRFVPVPQSAREKAYDFSPAFRELRPYLEGPPTDWARAEGQMFAGTSDLYAGLFYWLLRDAVARAGHHKSSSEAEAFYGRIATELEGGFQNGALQARKVSVPFLDPSLSVWLPHLPAAIWKISSLLYPVQQATCSAGSAVSSEVSALFDRNANRRAPAAEPPPIPATIEGWLSSAGPAIKRFDVVGRDLQPVGAQIETRSLPELGLPQPWTTALGFKVQWPFRQALAPYGFKIELENGELRLTHGLPPPLPNPSVFGMPDSEPLEISVSKLDEPQPQLSWRDLIREGLGSYYPSILKILAGLALLGVVVSSFRGWPLTTGLTLALGAILALIGSRVLLFAVLDASAWPGNQPRYLFPVATLSSALPSIILGAIIRFRVGSRLRRRSLLRRITAT